MLPQQTVLIIDECSQDRQTCRCYLQAETEHPYIILEQASGKGALALCRERKVDCILLEYLLPDLDGLEFLAELKQQAKTMPAVIMLTRHGNEAVAVRAIKSGVQDYLVKGQTTAAVLHSTIQSAIADISDRTLAEAARQESEARLRLALKTTQTIYWERDLSRDELLLSGTFTDPASSRVIPYREALTLVHPEDQEKVVHANESAIASLGSFEIEHRLMEPQADEWQYILARGTVVADATNRPTRIVGVSVNISERKQAEAALRQSEERYRYLSEAIPQIVWISNANGECEYFNQRWYELTGQTVEQAMKLGWLDVVHPEDSQRVMEIWTEAVRTGQLYEVELRYRRRDGTYRWYLERALPINGEQEGVLKWFGTSTDIDDRKQFEAERTRLLELEQNARAEAEAANHAKDEFVAMVSHDLRSPLNAIIGWATMLLTRKQDDATVARALEIIERNARSQAKLLEDLLDISRILRGKLKLEIFMVDLVSIINVAMETAYPSANAKSIRLVSILDDSIPPIMGDPNRLQQVLNNLLSNAIKFTPEGGQVEVQLFRNDNLTQITVSDTGIGISAEFLPYVFERYHQADCTKRQGGLGLGLAIARHIVELHGGTIQVVSSGEAQGAAFTIKLPLP